MRNLIKQTRRTTLTGLVIFLFGFLLISAYSFVEGIQQKMVSNLINVYTGDVLVRWDFSKLEDKNIPMKDGTTPDYLTEGFFLSRLSLELTNEYASSMTQLINKLRENDEIGIKSYHKRIAKEIKLYASENVFMMSLLGISVNEIDSLSNSIYLSEGSFPMNDKSILISESLKGKLGKRVGEEVSIRIKTAFGARNYNNYRISGYFEDRVPWNNFLAITNFNDASILYDLKNAFERLIIRLNRQSDTARVAKIINQEIQKNNLPFKAETYKQAGAFYLNIAKTTSYILQALLYFLLIITAFGINSSIKMNVRDRIGEIGTMKAIGMKKRMIVLLFMSESFLLSFIASVLGIAVSSVISAYLGKTGIKLDIEAAKYMFGDSYLNPYLTLEHIIITLTLITFLSIVASIGPAYNAGKLDPVKTFER